QAFPATAVSSNPTRNAGITLTSNFTPRFLGEFRITYTRLQNATVPTSAGFSMASLGFPQSLASAVTYKQFPEIDISQYYASSGLTVSTFNSPEVSCLGTGQSCGASASLNPQDTWHGLYQVTWIHGRHQLKAGADFQRMKLNAFLSRNAGGQFVFDRTYTGGPNPSVTPTNAANPFPTLPPGTPL